MKKYLGIVLALILCVAITGCGSDNELEGNDVNNIINGENSGGSNQKDNDKSNPEEAVIDLYSDDNKIVFNYMNVYFITYYYEGEQITGLEYIYQYEDAATAKIAKTMLDSTYAEEDNIKSVEVKGKYIIITFTEDEYKDETLEGVKTTYSYLEEMYKNN